MNKDQTNGTWDMIKGGRGSVPTMRGLAGLFVIVACGGPPGPAPTPSSPSPAPPVATPAPSPPPAMPTSRDCGEIGDTPTGLPLRVATGREAIGAGVLGPDAALQLGKVALRYETSAWHGTMRAGQRGPGLHVEIDRAEVGEHAPWGALVELYPDRAQAVEVGPYHIAVRAGAGDPPAELAITVTRETCPAVADLAPRPTPQWFWISSEGIRVHREPTGMGLQLALDLREQQPWLTVTNTDYRQALALRPDAAPQIRTGAATLTIERIEMGPNTRFDGRWSADGEPRVHALVRLEPGAAATDSPDPTPASSECGEASATRSATPSALAATPKIAETRTLKPGQKLQFGPLALDYGSFEIPARGQGPYREEAQRYPNLQVLGPQGGGTNLSGITREPRLLRIDTALLRVGPGGDHEKIKAERVALRCTAEHFMPPQQRPIYVWLGTLGHTYVRVGDFDVKAMNLQLYPDPVAPSLNFSSEHGSLMRPLGPELVGLAVTIDTYLVELVDVHVGVAGPDGLGPPARVQVRVSPRT